MVDRITLLLYVVLYAVVVFFFFFFFFSSRRRHTRSLCDWSSDVCSSDLLTIIPVLERWIDQKATYKAYEPQKIEKAGQVYERSEERRVGKECRSRGSPYH